METIRCIGIGNGGFSAHAEPQGSTSCSISGYDRDPDRVVSDLARRDHVEGAYVIDKRPAIDRRDGVRIAMRAPLLDLSNNARPFVPSDQTTALLGPGGVSGAYRGILAAAMVGSVNLDSCTLDDYVDYWRAAGARVGLVINGAIVWES